MQDQSIYEKLREYAKSDAYPFHMPGHKRKVDWISDAPQTVSPDRGETCFDAHSGGVL